MEIPSVVNSQSWTDLGSHKFSTEEASSESSAHSASGSPDHRGDDNVPEAQSCLLLEPDHVVAKLKSCVCVGHNNNEFIEAPCLQDPEQGLVNPLDLDRSPPTSTQLHEAGFVSSCSSDDCCGNFPLPVLDTKGQCDQILHLGQTADLYCGCVDVSDFKNIETISNGHVTLSTEDRCLTPDLDSSPTLSVTESVPDSNQRVLDLLRIVKHKPSSIAFSDYSGHHTFTNESSDDGESSQEEDDDDHGHGDSGDDDDDDDVIPDLPQSREILVNHRHRSNGKGNPKRKDAVSAQAETDYMGSNCGYEAEGETSSKEESPQIKSPWSESMSQLMRKLDQLNLDIEEALSASSSPSDTPCTIRKKQRGPVSKSTLNQTLNDQALQRLDRAACPSQDRSSAPRGASMGTRARSKKTMFNKMTDAVGAAGLRRPFL